MRRAAAVHYEEDGGYRRIVLLGGTWDDGGDTPSAGLYQLDPATGVLEQGVIQVRALRGKAWRFLVLAAPRRPPRTPLAWRAYPSGEGGRVLPTTAADDATCPPPAAFRSLTHRTAPPWCVWRAPLRLHTGHACSLGF